MANNIISSLGGGSGIDTTSLINDLVSINRAPDENRLDTKEATLETQISDYGLLRSALSELELSVAQLGSADTFDAKSVSVPETSLLGLTELDSSAIAGSYQVQVEQIAQSQSLASSGFSSADAEVGKGEITLRLGQWNAALDDFSVDTEKNGATIVIDDSNNTLEGLRDAINAADVGVQASIVSDGSSFRLLLTGPTGASNEVELTVAEDAGSPGLSQFDFNTVSQNMTQQQEGKDAILRVNGLQVTRETNSVDDVINGLSMDLFNVSNTETVNITIGEDRDLAETAIRDFVEAYNTFINAVEQLVGINDETGEYGSLHTDSMADNIIDQVRNVIKSTVPGIQGDFSSLAQLGIQTNVTDGTLSIDEDPARVNTNFNAVMAQNYDLVRDIFVPQTGSDSAAVEVTNFTQYSQPGSYEVIITQQPSRGSLSGAATAGFPLDTTGKDYSFAVEVDDKTAQISLPDGKTYTSGAELAAEIESLINAGQELSGTSTSITVDYDAGALNFISNAYGSSSKVNITSIGADTADLGLSVATGGVGTNVAGTVDGEVAFGSGQVLLPKLGTAAEGLALKIKEGATTATINFSRGFSGTMSSLINGFLGSTGLIASRESNIEQDLVDIEDDRTELDRRTDAYRARLESQFLAMELIVNNLTNTGSFLQDINDRLPFTAQS
ncbi:flagellar filament capping protein FliD [Gilvimarinus agarilyticus]|uniref:flagellar filament capping protein FliD n=1 Tax=Gilvimarinus sp. 2_MG-2023 TaxID=3062666 RepID=UPI001C08C9AA|nr:flagellar filament capping protein FliD [Gilvimarinus sp. 2_MG-2023]MBU2887246.1 flagellar filament capping protein FliD [Gilvimarinus agarilyticus]MDO6571905.1 flagellar filament capping protein FliD [Gilvimarinus sp. 2_MG-2023]